MDTKKRPDWFQRIHHVRMSRGSRSHRMVQMPSSQMTAEMNKPANVNQDQNKAMEELRGVQNQFSG